MVARVVQGLGSAASWISALALAGLGAPRRVQGATGGQCPGPRRCRGDAGRVGVDVVRPGARRGRPRHLLSCSRPCLLVGVFALWSPPSAATGLPPLTVLPLGPCCATAARLVSTTPARDADDRPRSLRPAPWAAAMIVTVVRARADPIEVRRAARSRRAARALGLGDRSPVRGFDRVDAVFAPFGGRETARAGVAGRRRAGGDRALGDRARGRARRRRDRDRAGDLRRRLQPRDLGRGPVAGRGLRRRASAGSRMASRTCSTRAATRSARCRRRPPRAQRRRPVAAIAASARACVVHRR